MIYVNDKPLRDADARCKSFYEQKTAELKKKYPKVLLIRENKLPRFYEYTSADGHTRRIPEEDTTFMCPLKCSKAVSEDGYADTWYWSSSAVVIEDGRVKLTNVSREIKGTLRIDMTKELDFAFFFVYILPFISGGRYYIVDEEAEAEKKLVTLSAHTDLDFYLTSENSPIYNDREALLVLASSWGIQNAELLGDARLKLKIRDAVLLSEANKEATKRGVKEFCHETKLGNIVKLRAKVQKAVDEGFIVFDVLNGGWFYSPKFYDGQQIIKSASPDLELLQKTAKDNPKIWQSINSMFAKPDSDPTHESKLNDNPPDMETVKEQLKQANFNVIGKTKDQLIEAWKALPKETNP